MNWRKSRRTYRKRAVTARSKARLDDVHTFVNQIAGQLESLSRQAVQEYTPIVGSIIQTRNRDIRHIERTLDGLLSFCAFDPALKLYKRLCRYYYGIDPVATAEYVYAYRDMWDSDKKPGIGEKE